MSVPWGSVEEEEEDIERMRQQIQQLEEDEVTGAEAPTCNEMAEQLRELQEQAPEVERLYQEVQRLTQRPGSSRRQEEPQAAANSGRGRGQQAAGYYGPDRSQVGQERAGSRLNHNGSSKQAKTGHSVAGVDTGGSRVVKSRRTSDLSVERVELGHVLVGAAIQQADRWMEQWDRLVGGRSSGHLRVSTPACSSEEKWRQGIWARQQLIDNGHTVWQEGEEAEWIGLIQQQYGYGYANLARLVPWVSNTQLDNNIS